MFTTCSSGSILGLEVQHILSSEALPILIYYRLYFLFSFLLYLYILLLPSTFSSVLPSRSTFSSPKSACAPFLFFPLFRSTSLHTRLYFFSFRLTRITVSSINLHTGPSPHPYISHIPLFLSFHPSRSLLFPVVLLDLRGKVLYACTTYLLCVSCGLFIPFFFLFRPCGVLYFLFFLCSFMVPHSRL
jgi:hypothetical protein